MVSACVATEPAPSATEFAALARAFVPKEVAFNAEDFASAPNASEPTPVACAASPKAIAFDWVA